MDIFKVFIIGIIVSLLAVFLKQVKPEYSFLCVLIGSVIIIVYIINSLTNVFAFFNNIVEKTGVDKDLFGMLIKVIGVGYLIEFSASVCEDSGNKSIADKIIIAGKLLIFLISMPIISNLFNLLLDLI